MDWTSGVTSRSRRMVRVSLCRAAVRGNLKIMLPMVATPRDLAHGRAHLDAVVADLAARKVPYAVPQLGIMVETPAAAIAIDDGPCHAPPVRPSMTDW